MLPMLASNYVESKLRFPLIAQPKIDGVRGLCLEGVLTGRSLKTHANKYTTALYSNELLRGLDGELAADHETHPSLCRLTTSAINTIQGTPYTLWHLFDLVTQFTRQFTYEMRYAALFAHVYAVKAADPSLGSFLRVVPSVTCNTLRELLAVEERWLNMGYEGTIIRDPDGLYKEGRSTAVEGGLLRIKRFTEEEAIVLRIVEGQSNMNESVVNEVGRASRSTHAENMVPNAMVGSLICEDVKTEQEITVAAGSMPHSDRALYFQHPELIVGQVIKYKRFKHGTKDKPRFPTFQTIRASSDIG